MNSQPQRISAEHRGNITETEVLVELVLLVTLAYRHTGKNKKSQKVLDKPLEPCYISYAVVLHK